MIVHDFAPCRSGQPIAESIAEYVMPLRRIARTFDATARSARRAGFAERIARSARRPIRNASERMKASSVAAARATAL